MAAAIGAELPILEPTGSMVLDIGGGTTEVGVISLGGVVYAHSLRVAGDKMDEAIVNFVRRKYGILIGEATAEPGQKNIGTAWEGSEVREMEIKGRHIADGVPRAQILTSQEVHQALSECLGGIVSAIKTALEQTPPELGADVADKGLVVSGGGALLRDIDRMLTEQTGLPIIIAEDPLTTARSGARLRPRADGGGTARRCLRPRSKSRLVVAAQAVHDHRLREPYPLRSPSPFARLVLLAALSTLLMVLDHRGHYLDRLRSTTMVIIRPIYAVAGLPAGVIEAVGDFFTTSRTLRHEVATLRDETRELKARQLSYDALQAENERLRQRLASAARVATRLMAADLIEVAAEPYARKIVVARGSRQGIFVGQPAIDAHGVLGQVPRSPPT